VQLPMFHMSVCFIRKLVGCGFRLPGYHTWLQVAKETTSGAVSMTFNHINFTNAYRYALTARAQLMLSWTWREWCLVWTWYMVMCVQGSRQPGACNYSNWEGDCTNTAGHCPL
jgi:hypothetical protein